MTVGVVRTPRKFVSGPPFLDSQVNSADYTSCGVAPAIAHSADSVRRLIDSDKSWIAERRKNSVVDIFMGFTVSKIR